MSQNRFGVDTAYPPPPPPQVPGWPPQQPGPPPGRPHRRRHWPVYTTAAVLSAVIASVAAAAITVQFRDSGAPASPTESAPVTVTVPSPTASAPTPLPTGQADQQTCRQGWIPAGNLTKEAISALQVLPAGTQVGDPAVQANPQWSAAVRDAATSYTRAADALDSAIAPGTTPVLAEAAHTAVDALRLLGDAMIKGDPINGNAAEIANSAGGHVGLLCQRLAP